MKLSESVQALCGIGEKRAKVLGKVGIETIKDILYYLPRDYKDFSQYKKISEVQNGETALMAVKVFTNPRINRPRRGLEITTFQVTDATEVVGVDIFNQVNIKRNIEQGKTIYIYGKLERKFKKRKIVSPEIYFSKPEDKFMPIYPLTAGLTQNMMRKYIKEALYEVQIFEPYSDAFLRRHKLLGLKEALQKVHFPTDLQLEEKARARIVFDELLIFNRMLDLLGEEKRIENQIRVSGRSVETFEKKLPFKLTGAQKRVMQELQSDFGSEYTMNRLVQGDVGSGKTVIAFFAMDCMRQSGYQSMLMAPTEILAQQHYETAKQLFPEEEIVCVTGSLTKKRKEVLRKKIEKGDIKIIIGTHALLYGDFSFEKLGLIITDEQHRFGVKQRAALSGEKSYVHTLIMSATPIPRSLSLVLFGQTDVSIVDELPPGRKEIKTYLIYGKKYNDMIAFIRNELQSGRQAYIVCPLIEDSEGMDAASAKQMLEELKLCYPNFTIELIHGKLKNKEKQEIMEAFDAGKTKLLVSTTVIEVGINVPNATVMVVMNAERFGLAQLHQLRGRVGRGREQSYCFLVSENQGAYERLRILTATNDGFKIAEQDMRLRGSGDILGTRQHGKGTLRVANLVTNVDVLVKTREVLLAMKEQNGQEFETITRAAQKKLNDTLIEIALN